MPLQNECIWGYTEISLSVRASVCPMSIHVSVCVQNTGLCQITGGGRKSHSVTALV